MKVARWYGKVGRCDTEVMVGDGMLFSQKVAGCYSIGGTSVSRLTTD